MKFELKPPQRKAVEELSVGKILYGGTGVGKSITSLAFFYEKICGGDLAKIPSMDNPRDLYIMTTKKKRDDKEWEADAVKMGLGVHNDSLDGINMVVDTWNNINKYKDVKDAFFIFDEQRVVGSGSWSKAFIKIAKQNPWILLSATPGDTWLDYIPVFVANGWYKNRTEFKRRHVVYNTFSKFPKVDRYLETGTLVRHRNAVLVHMPYPRHTVRRSKDVHVEYNVELFNLVKDKRWNPYEERPIRDVAEMFAVMRKVVNSDVTRLAAVQTLTQVHPKLIVFYNFDYELEKLRSLAWNLDPSNNSWQPGTPMNTSSNSPESPESPEQTQGDSWEGTVYDPSSPLVSRSSEIPMIKAKAEFEMKNARTPNPSTSTSKESTSDQSVTVAEWNGHRHQAIPKTDRWVYLVQYAAGSEGWNCVETDAICFYSQTYSYKHWHQAHGRIDRMNTPFTDLWYYRLISKSFMDAAVAKSLKAKKSFNESSVQLWTPDSAKTH